MACLEITDRIFTDTELINLYKSIKDKYYIEKLYNRYEQLLNKIAFKYSHINSLYSYEDLKSESYIALVKAVESYDPGRGSFSTFLFTSLNHYLYQVVNGATSKEKGNNELYKKQISIYTVLDNQNGDAEVGLIDTIEDKVAQEMIDNLPEIMFISDLHDKLDNALNNLTEKQKTVIECINGFNSEIYKEAELASDMHVTPGRINEIKNNAYRKLRGNKELRKIFSEEFSSYSLFPCVL